MQTIFIRETQQQTEIDHYRAILRFSPIVLKVEEEKKISFIFIYGISIIGQICIVLFSHFTLIT
jgi:hypothetical protein